MPQEIDNTPKQSIYYGPYAPFADLVVLDTVFVNGLSKYILVGGAGDVVFENEAGVPQFVKSVQAGTLLPVIAKRILTSGTVNGTPRTTTATDMSFLGGY